MTGFGFGSVRTKNLTGVFRNEYNRERNWFQPRFLPASIARRLIDGFFLEPAQLVFELGHTVVETLQDFAHVGRKNDTVRAMMSRGIAALDGIFELFAAGAAGAGTLAGGDFFHGKELTKKSKTRNSKTERIPKFEARNSRGK
jgi:hypothetical protein